MLRAKLVIFLLVIPTSLFSQNPGPSVTGAKAISTMPVIRNSNVTSSASAASLAVSMPSGAQVGDLAVCILGLEYAVGTAPSGWTAVQTSSVPSYADVNGAYYYKTLTSGDISGSATFSSSSGSAAMAVICVDFTGQFGGYTSPNSSYVKVVDTGSSKTAPTLTASGSPQAGDMILWTALSRSNGTNTVSRGSLLQSATPSTALTISVYDEVLATSFPTAVTYSYPGTYNPAGNYSAWFDVTR